MTLLVPARGRHEIAYQADRCRAMGSPFVASVLEAVYRQLAHAPLSASMITNWPGNPAAAAVAMRVNGALHALARRGITPRLAALYRGEHGDFDGAIAEVLSREDQFIADWLSSPTQTNEVGRAAAIMAALMSVAWRWPMPFDLLELGTSCGLNLNLAHYAYRLDKIDLGEPSSSVHIEPEWRGAAPPVAPVSIATARGVDLHPLTASDPSHRERLLAFAWADQPGRSQRLENALGIAQHFPPRVEQGDAVDWLADRLAEPQEAGHCRAVVHTMFMQYLSDQDRNQISASMAAAGARAEQDRPLVWITFEWGPGRREVELRLTSWPYGVSQLLARCHPYGDWIEWLEPLHPGTTAP